MYHNFTFPTVTEALPTLLTALHARGLEVGSRVGRTQELTHVGITLTEPLDREILVHHRKANIAAQIAETMWVLSGRDDIAWLENYLPRVRDFSDDGETWRAGYGKRLRKWEDHGNAEVVDQWRWLVDHLREQPGSRRAVMSIWDPIRDTKDGKDIPCNDWLSFLSRNGYLDLHVALRSNDIIWGWSGINQFEWSAMLEITAGMLGMKVGSLHFSTTSFHQYDHHFAKGQKIIDAGLANTDHLSASPRFDASVVHRDFGWLEDLFDRWFRIEYDIRTGSPLVQHYVDTFPEPMLRSWLRIIQWWWSQGVRQDEYLEPIKGTRLAEATRYAMQPPRKETQKMAQIAAGYGASRAKVDQVMEADPDRPSCNDRCYGENCVHLRVGSPCPKCGTNMTTSGGRHPLRCMAAVCRFEPGSEQPEGVVSPFLDSVFDLHLAKHAAYKDSWKKRGEKFSILPNIGRKVDRLGQAETDDETSTDTIVDLMVYLAKYTTWLNDRYSIDGPDNSDDPGDTHKVLANIEFEEGPNRLFIAKECFEAEDFLRSEYENLLQFVEADDSQSVTVSVDLMLRRAYLLAHTAWDSEQTKPKDVTEDEYQGADFD